MSASRGEASGSASVVARSPVAGASERRSAWVAPGWGHGSVLACTLLWLGFTAWLRPLSLPDEGRYVGVAWEMLRSGDWLVPRLDGLPFFHKPPLFYWITAGSLSLFGTNAWAGRVAPWLGASAVAFGLYVFAHRWAGRRMARASLLVLLTQPLFFAGAQYANLDMLIAACIGGTILAAAHAVQCLRVGSPHRGWLVAAYALAAVGVLAKGLIGVVLPVAVVLLWLAFTQAPRRAAGIARTLVSLPGTLVFLALAAPWFAAMQARFSAFLHYFFVVQHFQRFAGAGFNNVRPFWFFVPVLLASTLPWSGWLWRLSPRGRGRGLDDPESPARAAPALRRLMWTWLAVVVVFFSIPGSKLVGYILPACTPLAFLVADAGRRAWAGAHGTAWWKASIAIGAVACLAVVGIARVVDGSSTRPLAEAYAASAGAARGEPLVMLDDYFYDVPMLARVALPVAVIADWSSPSVGSRDNWEKELADAASFAPDRGSSVLVDSKRLPAVLCVGPAHWLIAPRGAGERLPWLARLVPAASTRRASLWRVDAADPVVAAALGCRAAAVGSSP